MREGALIGRTVKCSFMIAHRRPLALRANPLVVVTPFGTTTMPVSTRYIVRRAQFLLRGRAQSAVRERYLGKRSTSG
jgi:hypothetical protein